MSKTMTTTMEHLGAGDLTSTGERSHPLSNYWKALVPIAVGAVLLLLPIPGRSQTQCMVLLRAVRRGDHRFDP